MTARLFAGRRALAATAIALSASVAGISMPALTGTSIAQAQISLGTQTFAAGCGADGNVNVVLPEEVQLVNNVTVSGLPEGLIFSGTKPYTISGTPTTPGTYTVTATGQAPIVGAISASGTIVITGEAPVTCPEPTPTPTDPTSTPTAPPTDDPTSTPTAPPAEEPTPTTERSSSGSSGSSDIDPKVAVGASALALGSVALSSGGSSEGSSQKPEEKKTETGKPAEGNAPEKAIAPEAPQKGIDPNAAPAAPQKGIAPKAAPKATKSNRGMLASTGVEFPVVSVLAAMSLVTAAGVFILRRREV